MFCILCQEHRVEKCSKSGVWVTKGCLSYTEDKVRKHEKSHAHHEAVIRAAKKAVAE